jgi:hypothetical protein
MLLLLLLLLVLLLIAVSWTNGQNCTGICGSSAAAGGTGIEQQQQQTAALLLLNAGQVVIVDGQQGTCGFFDALCLNDDEINQKAQDAGCLCGTPFICSGICGADGEELFDATLEVTVNGLLATCGFHNSRIQQESITQESCLDEAFAARQAGCKCVGTANYTCNGICGGGDHGESDADVELLNFDQDVNVDGQILFCGFHDNRIKEEESSESGCMDYRQKVLNAGCVCGTRYECPGVCSRGERLVNDTLTVSVSGLSLATCAFHDAKLKEEIIEERCLFQASTAREAGCVCIVDEEQKYENDFNCPGVCSTGELLFNAQANVQVDNQTTVSCGFLNAKAKEEIDDEQRCLDAASEAQGAGCVCVVPLGDPSETSAATGTATYSIVYSYAMLFLASILAVGVAI